MSTIWLHVHLNDLRLLFLEQGVTSCAEEVVLAVVLIQHLDHLHAGAIIAVEAANSEHLHVMVLTVRFTLVQHELVPRERSFALVTEEVLRTPGLAGSLDSSSIDSLLTSSAHVLYDGVETQLTVELVIFLLVFVI